MKSGKLLNLLVFVVLLLGLVPAAVVAMPAEPQAAPTPSVATRPPKDVTPQLGAAPGAGGVNSLSGSNVTFTPAAGGDTCAIPGAPQTFCFTAHSFTNDWEYVYNVWLKFPADWTVTNVYVQGTPVCTGGGTFGTLTWSFQTSPYEVNIYHPRYQAYTDDCTAVYCVEAVPGTVLPSAPESWYWDGDGYNAAPHNPCSSDVYTPAGQNACDEYVNPQADIPPCNLPEGVYLTPPTQTASGCNGVPQEHTVSLFNHTGAAGTFNLAYSVSTANGTLTGPATVAAGVDETVPIVVTLTPDLCALMGDDVVGQVDAAGNGYSDSAVITKTVATGGGWESVPASKPSWGGYGYVSDGCTAVNAGGETVTYMIGDTSGTGPVGFWGYNHDTNTWFQPGAANTPADRWAPDWAYDPATNLCYLTGGANTPGAGTYNEAYVYNPNTNAFTQLPSFTNVRDFHDSWVGYVDGVKYMCIGGGNNGAGLTSTQCFDIAAGTWAGENATIGAYPTDIWGAADGVLNAPGGDQFWTVAGAQTGSYIADAAFYFDDADNLWHSAGNTGVARYRVEGDFFDGAFFQVAGSDGTFTGTTDVRRGSNVGGTWTWEAFPNVPNRRMDNIAVFVDGTMWSIEGYGSTANDYVDVYQGCPECDLQGWLEGTVLDGDTQLPKSAANSPQSLTGSFVVFDPSVGGDTCYDPGATQTFCFRDESFSPDYAYVYNVWQKFPADWTVSNAYVVGTPWCDNGSWGSFSWTFETSPYEVNINHPRYQGSGGAHCIAYYCFDVVPGTGGDVSWYWAGDDYGNPPKHPCSDDIYTPASQTDACDEWVNPQAEVPPCNIELGPTCQGATVVINPGNIHVPVDPATGHYGPVQLIQGEYTVEASAPGYTTETALVQIVDELTTVQNFVLYRPVIDVTPLSFTIAAPPNTPVVETLTISNLGHEPLDYEILEIPPLGAATHVATTRVTVPAVAADKIEAALAEQLAAGPSDFFVWLDEKADLTQAKLLTTKAEKGQFVYDSLTTVAERTQQALRASLDQKGVEYKPFYIANKILVKGGSQALAMDIAARPDVARLTANHTFQLQKPVKTEPAGQPNAVEPNLTFIKVDQVWAMGVFGQGTVLAGNDTGLDETVSSVAPHYRGCLNPPTCSSWDHNYNWWDATGTYPNDPYDGFGHGTHTTGTMVGDDGGTNQIGVAPGAQTIHCKNMTDGGSGDDGTFSECFQWDLAPWDLSGANADPSKAPDAVNNSWGYGGGGAPQFEDEIAALQAAGILVEVSAGNEGAGCGTLRSPGDYVDVLTTGSVEHTGSFPGTITGFSSRGPSALYPNDYFPDIMAPGNGIRSQVPGGAYEYWSGTSMAGPHATALIGLMWSAAPGLRGQVPETIDIIHQTAGRLTGQMGSNCGGDYTVGPNNDWGFGTIDALAAVEEAMVGSDIPWVTEVPVSGTIPAFDYQDVVVTFECTPDQEGFVLTGTLRINHNDPCADSIDIPLEFTCGQPTPPDIDVQPPALSSTQLQNEITVQQMDVHNMGSDALDWTIIEHNPLALGPAAPNAPQANADVAPASRAPIGPMAVGDLLFEVDFGAATGDTQILGVEFDGTYYWATGGASGVDPNKLYKIDQSGALVASYDQPAACTGWGGRDLAFDGSYLYFGCDDNQIHQIDPATGTQVGTIPFATQLARALAYDPATDSFWTANWDSTIYNFNRSGGTIGTCAAVGLSTYGLAWDQWSAGGPYLWFWSQDGPDPLLTASQFNPATCAMTGVSFLGSGVAGEMAGGAAASGTLAPGKIVLLGMNQGVSDRVGVYELSVNAPPECEPVDIPWAYANPTSGTTLGHTGFNVDVTFDSTGLAAGTYTANLCVESNDPDEPFVSVPLEMTVLALQNIVVTPSELYQELCPDQQATQQITICNTGDLPLDWTIKEMSPTLPLVGRGAGVKGVGEKAPTSVASTSGQAANRGIDPTIVPPAPLAPEDILIEQLPNQVNGLFVDSACSLCPTGQQSVADNFILLEETWLTNIVFWSGYYSADTPIDPDHIRVLIHEDAGGFPGAVVYDESEVQYERAQTGVILFGVHEWMHTLNLADEVDLPAGTYWVEIFNNTGTDDDDFFWETGNLDPVHGVYDSAWAQETPGVTWYANGGYDMSMQIIGHVIPPFDALWLDEDPTSGTVAPHTCQVVDVTFDSTGLTPGDYFADLLIESNDPDEPEITIPVQLTVLDAVSGADYAFSPADPVVGETVLFSGTVASGTPTYWNWDFDDGTTGTGQYVSHAFAAAGTYTVILTVGGGCNELTVQYDVVVVEGCDAPLGANFTFDPVSPFVGDTVTFNATIGSGTGPFTFDWTFGDGGTATGQSVTHVFATAGTFPVHLTVSNACGQAVMDIDVIVQEVPPPHYFYYLPITTKGYMAPGR